jgi:hypothetical protein
MALPYPQNHVFEEAALDQEESARRRGARDASLVIPLP